MATLTFTQLLSPDYLIKISVLVKSVCSLILFPNAGSQLSFSVFLSFLDQTYHDSEVKESKLMSRIPDLLSRSKLKYQTYHDNDSKESWLKYLTYHDRETSHGWSTRLTMTVKLKSRLKYKTYHDSETKESRLEYQTYHDSETKESWLKYLTYHDRETRVMAGVPDLP